MSEHASLTDRRIVIVGGGSRLGAALAAAAAERGADVVVAARTAPTAPGTSYVPVDLSDPSSIVRMADAVGEFDHLVSTVSMHATGPLNELADETIQRSIDAKILGPMRLARATAGRVRPGGSLTFFSGQAAWRPARGGVVTATVNGALAFLVQALAVELAPVRVNAVAPGLVDSGSLDALGPERKQELLDAAVRRNPVGRVGTPDDVVDATLMVLGNGYMSGTVLHVDGGGPLG